MEFAKQQPTAKRPAKGPADWFTGDVWFDVIHAGQEPSRMRASLVRFSPGARTHWHSHALGQALYVVSGTALIGTCDGTVLAPPPAHRAGWHRYKCPVQSHRLRSGRRGAAQSFAPQLNSSAAHGRSSPRCRS